MGIQLALRKVLKGELVDVLKLLEATVVAVAEARKAFDDDRETTRAYQEATRRHVLQQTTDAVTNALENHRQVMVREMHHMTAGMRSHSSLNFGLDGDSMPETLQVLQQNLEHKLTCMEVRLLESRAKSLA